MKLKIRKLGGGTTYLKTGKLKTSSPTITRTVSVDRSGNIKKPTGERVTAKVNGKSTVNNQRGVINVGRGGNVISKRVETVDVETGETIAVQETTAEATQVRAVPRQNPIVETIVKGGTIVRTGEEAMFGFNIDKTTNTRRVYENTNPLNPSGFKSRYEALQKQRKEEEFAPYEAETLLERKREIEERNLSNKQRNIYNAQANEFNYKWGETYKSDRDLVLESNLWGKRALANIGTGTEIAATSFIEFETLSLVGAPVMKGLAGTKFGLGVAKFTPPIVKATLPLGLTTAYATFPTAREIKQEGWEYAGVATASRFVGFGGIQATGYAYKNVKPYFDSKSVNTFKPKQYLAQEDTFYGKDMVSQGTEVTAEGKVNIVERPFGIKRATLTTYGDIVTTQKTPRDLFKFGGGEKVISTTAATRVIEKDFIIKDVNRGEYFGGWETKSGIENLKYTDPNRVYYIGKEIGMGNQVVGSSFKTGQRSFFSSGFTQQGGATISGEINPVVEPSGFRYTKATGTFTSEGISGTYVGRTYGQPAPTKVLTSVDFGFNQIKPDFTNLPKADTNKFFSGMNKRGGFGFGGTSQIISEYGVVSQVTNLPPRATGFGKLNFVTPITETSMPPIYSTSTLMNEKARVTPINKLGLIASSRTKYMGGLGEFTRITPTDLTFETQIPRQSSLQTTDTSQITETDLTTIGGVISTTGGNLPPIDPTEIPNFSPFLFDLGGFGGGKSTRRFKKQPKGFAPSLTALTFNIRGSTSKLGELSGLGLRPIPFNPKKRKRR